MQHAIQFIYKGFYSLSLSMYVYSMLMYVIYIYVFVYVLFLHMYILCTCQGIVFPSIGDLHVLAFFCVGSSSDILEPRHPELELRI